MTLSAYGLDLLILSRLFIRTEIININNNFNNNNNIYHSTVTIHAVIIIFFITIPIIIGRIRN